MKRSNLWIFAAVLPGLALGSAGAAANPDPPVAASAPSAATSAPDDSVLGTVQVTGAAGVGIVYPKLAVVPLVTKSDADTLAQLVTKRDFELSDEYDVVDGVPDGPFLRDTELTLGDWKKKGIEIVVRVWADGSGPATKLYGDLRFTTDRLAKEDATWKAAFQTTVPIGAASVRGATHVLVDRLFGALTGKPGAFASELAYSTAVGTARQIRRLDADGFDLRDYGPAGQTALLPSIGSAGDIWYALSANYSPYRLVHGPQATPLSLAAPGSLLGYSFSPTRDRLAVAFMAGGVSTIYLGKADGTDLVAIKTPKYADHPVLGPLGKVAYVADYRVWVDGKAISPAGFVASAPTFCDTDLGLLVLFTVGVGKGADLIGTDTTGGGLFRLTMGQGANTWAACSPDGRRVGYFSTRTNGEGPGLYLANLRDPSRAHRISKEPGEGLSWARRDDLTAVAATP